MFFRKKIKTHINKNISDYGTPLLVKSWKSDKEDHYYFIKTDHSGFSDFHTCFCCHAQDLTLISTVENKKEEKGISTSFCQNCHNIQHTRNKSNAWYNNHFSKFWYSRSQKENLIHSDFSVFQKTSSYLPQKANILDIGCGLGTKLIPFMNQGHNVYGIEPSENRSQQAKKILGQSIFTGPVETVFKKHRHTFPKFHLIYFFNVLDFIENPFSILEQCLSLLDENSVIYIRHGVYTEKNLFVVSHSGVNRSFISFDTFSYYANQKNLNISILKKNPLEILLSPQLNLSKSQIATHIDLNTIQNHFIKQLKLKNLNQKGSSTIRYPTFHRVLTLSKITPHIEVSKNSHSFFPVRFIHDIDQIPVLLK